MHLFKGNLTAACRTQRRRMSLFRRTTTWLKLKLEISLLIEFVSLYIIWCIIVIWRTSTSWVVKRNKRNNICRTKLATIWTFWHHNMSRYESQITQKWTFDTTIWVNMSQYSQGSLLTPLKFLQEISLDQTALSLNSNSYLWITEPSRFGCERWQTILVF